MQEHSIRHIPVVTEHHTMAGLLTRETVLKAIPWSASSLSALETQYVLSKITAGKVMIRDVITVSEDVAVEEAARIMADRKIGGLPVMREQTLAGIITETDLFKVLLEMLGGRRPGVRVTVSVPGVRGTLAKVTNAVFDADGDIVGLGISEVSGSSGTQWEIMLKVQYVSQNKLVEALRPVVEEIVEVR